MRRWTAVVAACGVLLAMCGMALGDWFVTDHGRWPATWPKELEGLRDRARTLEGSVLNLIRHEIPFDDRAEFEAAWPHLLKVKSRGAPLVLVRGPIKELGGEVKAGVVVHCPPAGYVEGEGEERVQGERADPKSWLFTTYLVLVVDGEVVDLNRVRLPGETPVIDQRFGDHEPGAQATESP